jgi:hypothetical protein
MRSFHTEECSGMRLSSRGLRKVDRVLVSVFGVDTWSHGERSEVLSETH